MSAVAVAKKPIRSTIPDGTSRTGLFIGYLVGAAIMILGGIVEIVCGVNAEGKSLESVTKPLTSVPDDVAPPLTGPVAEAPA